MCIFIQFMFIIELYVRMRKFCVEEAGAIKSSPKSILMAYKAEWMYWDLASNLPMYYFAVALGAREDIASLFFLFQMLRLVRYFDYWSFIDLYLTKQHIGKNSAVMQVSKIVILIMILVAALASVLIELGCSSTDANNACNEPNSWMNEAALNEHEGGLAKEGRSMDQLNAAVYVVSQALYTLGYGDVPTSSSPLLRGFTTLMMLTGAFSFAMVIAVMSSVIANQDMLYMEYRQNLEQVMGYMKFRNLKDKLQSKVLNHFDYLFTTQYGKLEIQILNELPSALKSEVLMLNEYLVKTHPFIKGTNDAFFSGEMIKILIPRTYSPNEIIVLRQSPLNCMVRKKGPPSVLALRHGFDFSIHCFPSIAPLNLTHALSQNLMT